MLRRAGFHDIPFIDAATPPVADVDLRARLAALRHDLVGVTAIIPAICAADNVLKIAAAAQFGPKLCASLDFRLDTSRRLSGAQLSDRETTADRATRAAGRCKGGAGRIKDRAPARPLAIPPQEAARADRQRTPTVRKN